MSYILNSLKWGCIGGSLKKGLLGLGFRGSDFWRCCTQLSGFRAMVWSFGVGGENRLTKAAISHGFRD